VAARALWTDNRSAVVVTCNSEGSLYLSGEEPGMTYHQPALELKVVDTSGCGDVFHGTSAAALSEGAGGEGG
jgi:sugar/nucleoside kinase (ribokinase family)